MPWPLVSLPHILLTNSLQPLATRLLCVFTTSLANRVAVCLPCLCSTINSLLNERVAAAAAFQQDNAKPTVYSRTAGGFTLHCIDTPSILEQDNVSEAVSEEGAAHSAACNQPGKTWSSAWQATQGSERIVAGRV